MILAHLTPPRAPAPGGVRQRAEARKDGLYLHRQVHVAPRHAFDDAAEELRKGHYHRQLHFVLERGHLPRHRSPRNPHPCATTRAHLANVNAARSITCAPLGVGSRMQPSPVWEVV